MISMAVAKNRNKVVFVLVTISPFFYNIFMEPLSSVHETSKDKTVQMIPRSNKLFQNT